MKGLASVTKRFPMHELVIRRLHASDPDFRETCEGHATACCALERWKADRERADEYRTLIAEIEEEIIEYVEGRRGQKKLTVPRINSGFQRSNNGEQK